MAVVAAVCGWVEVPNRHSLKCVTNAWIAGGDHPIEIDSNDRRLSERIFFRIFYLQEKRPGGHLEPRDDSGGGWQADIQATLRLVVQQRRGDDNAEEEEAVSCYQYPPAYTIAPMDEQ